MIPYRNCEVFASVIFFFVIKIFCSIVTRIRMSVMYKKQATLTSIPESNENEEERDTKWVPKKKHEVLKAKYKCLKKLFQIYDASVIGILPESYMTDGYIEEEIQTKKRRKKRSHRTKTDACAGTTEVSSGDVTQVLEDTDKESIATAVMRDLKLAPPSCTCLEQTKEHTPIKDSGENIHNTTVEQGCECTQPIYPPLIPYYNEKRRLTRFQSFVHRIFGIQQEKLYFSPNGHMYAASDNMIPHSYSEKRRRRGLRFRKLKRPKKIQSESALRDVKNPVILTYVQSVQRNCLMDTTPRQCPIVGCRMIFYGIINYNDHLNLCHFVDRKYICHYCHEGFEREYDKFVHENEHLGITRLGPIMEPPSSVRQSMKNTSDTQTDPEITRLNVSEDKLKKIVSFFDKISDPDQVLSEIKKNRYSESNLRHSKSETAETGEDMSDSSTTRTDSSANRTNSSHKPAVSCINLNRKLDRTKFGSEGILKRSLDTIACHLCGEQFDYRQQLAQHEELEHRVHDKFSKFHSCLGISRRSNHFDMISEDGKIKVQSIDRSQSGLGQINTSSTLSIESYSEVSRKRTEESLSCNPSANVMYYSSEENVKKPSVVGNIVSKVRSGITSYKWEPGTKIIRV